MRLPIQTNEPIPRDSMPRRVRATGGHVPVPQMLLGLCLLLIGAGCSTTAPMCVWQQPTMQPAMGSTLLITKLRGAHGFSEAVEHELAKSVPGHLERSVDLVSISELRPESTIALASAVTEDAMPAKEASDLEIIDLARQHNIDYVLMGEVLRQQRMTGRPEWTEVVVSWKLHDVKRNDVVGGFPVRLELPNAVEAAEIFQASTGSQQEQVAGARRIASASWRLLSPHVTTMETRLANPWWGWGASRIRRGNELAEQGKWPEAETLWKEVLDQHPTNHAAMHNLSLAAVAREDFRQAKRLAQQALQLRASDHYEETFVWIEQRQFDYRNGHGLGQPAGGYMFVRPQDAN